MSTVTLNATAATYIELENATTNYNGSAFFTVGEWNGGNQTNRGLLNFDIAGASIPTAAIITSVKLRLYDENQNYSSNDRTMRVYRLLRAFNASQTTWNKASTSPDADWSTAGVGHTTNDREATDVGTVTMPATEVLGYTEITLSTASIQDVVLGTFTFRGYLLKMDTEANDMHQFSDQGTGNPPQLVIDYEMPIGGYIFTSY